MGKKGKGKKKGGPKKAKSKQPAGVPASAGPSHACELHTTVRDKSKGAVHDAFQQTTQAIDSTSQPRAGLPRSHTCPQPHTQLVPCLNAFLLLLVQSSLTTLCLPLSFLFSRLLEPLLLTDGLSREFKLPFSIPVKDFGPDPTVSPAKPELAIRHVRAWCSGPFIKHILDSEPWVCSVRDACSKRATTVVMTPGMYQEKVRFNRGDPRTAETGGRRPAGGFKRG